MELPQTNQEAVSIGEGQLEESNGSTFLSSSAVPLTVQPNHQRYARQTILEICFTRFLALHHFNRIGGNIEEWMFLSRFGALFLVFGWCPARPRMSVCAMLSIDLHWFMAGKIPNCRGVPRLKFFGWIPVQRRWCVCFSL